MSSSADSMSEQQQDRVADGLAPGRGSETILSRARKQAEEPNHAVTDLGKALELEHAIQR